MSHKLSTKEDIEELSKIRYIQSFSPCPAGETPGTMHLRSLSTGALGRSGLRTCRTTEALTDEIDDYWDYDNKFRYQWGLKKMTPVQAGITFLVNFSYTFIV